MSHLTGTYAHQMDTKNRIRIPSKLKLETGQIYFMKGPNKRINVFSEEEFNKFAQKIEENTKLSDSEQRRAVSAIMMSAFPVEADAQGRMILPSVLKEYAKIDKDIMICGAGTHIDIWAKAVHAEYFANIDEDFDNLYNLIGI